MGCMPIKGKGAIEWGGGGVGQPAFYTGAQNVFTFIRED